jgi:hypothetical protein
MRSLGLAIVLAACPSSSPDQPGPPDGSAPVMCGTSLTSYCEANRCDPTLSEAEQDRTLCPASLAVCGSYTAITQIGIDTSTSLYYLGDQLVAIDHTLFPSRVTCTAGPATFSPPSCAPGGTQLPACAQ